jgi:hypothetical protein
VAAAVAEAGDVVEAGVGAAAGVEGVGAGVAVTGVGGVDIGDGVAGGLAAVTGVAVTGNSGYPLQGAPRS